MFDFKVVYDGFIRSKSTTYLLIGGLHDQITRTMNDS